MKQARPVYSTDQGRLCSGCGQAVDACRCVAVAAHSLPDRIVARLAIEKAGRRGKTVTVIYGLPRNQPFLKGLAKDLKRLCGSGGTAYDDRVEIQGEHRDRIREELESRGWTVKG